MSLINQLFPDIVNEAQDIQASVEQNEVRQQEVKSKIKILIRAYSQSMSADDFEYFQKVEIKLREELKKLVAANVNLQEKYRTLINRVSILQKASNDYEAGI